MGSLGERCCQKRVVLFLTIFNEAGVYDNGGDCYRVYVRIAIKRNNKGLGKRVSLIF